MLLRFAPLLALCLCLQDPAAGPETGSLEAFRFDAEKLEVGRVYQYEHSNVDGSHATRVSLYWAGENRLESLKWSPNWQEATLVRAEMDWKTFSVKSFATDKIAADGTRTPVGRLETVGDELVVGPTRCRVEFLPWHSYDFDLASLNVSLRFLVDPEEPLILSLADFVQAPTPGFRFKGEVALEYLEDEERGGIACRKYSFEGPGMEDRGGLLWAAKDPRPYFVDFEFDLPDEPGLTSGKLRLLGTSELTPEQWQAFVAKREG